MQLCVEEMPEESERLRRMRDRIYDGLCEAISGVTLNGPLLKPEWRTPGNLNISIDYVAGETLLMSMKDLALSTGSACTSASPEPMARISCPG